MSITTRILHICNHNIVESVVTDKDIILTRDHNNDFDVIDTDGFIHNIDQIVQGENIFIKDIDYEIFAHNKIKWIGIIRPKQRTEYKVYYRTLIKTTIQHDPHECPRCQGNGWYVSVLDNNPDNFLSAKGSMKMIQDYVKLLLTIKNQVLGTNLLTLASGEMYDPQLVANEIAMSVRDAETQQKNFQLQLLEEGSPLPDDERLYKVEIRSIEFDEVNSGFIVSLEIYNYSGDFSSINLKV